MLSFSGAFNHIAASISGVCSVVSEMDPVSSAVVSTHSTFRTPSSENFKPKRMKVTGIKSRLSSHVNRSITMTTEQSPTADDVAQLKARTVRRP